MAKVGEAVAEGVAARRREGGGGDGGEGEVEEAVEMGERTLATVALTARWGR